MQTPEDVVAETVKAIQAACITLEDLGYNSLVIITIEQRHTEIGSTKGRRFYKENFDMIEKFVEFCKVDDLNLQDEEMSGTSDIPEDQKYPVVTMPLEHATICKEEDVAPTTRYTFALNPNTDDMSTYEGYADGHDNLANKNLISLKEADNDLKSVETDKEPDNDPGHIVAKINMAQPVMPKVEIPDGDDDADAALSALDDGDDDDDWISTNDYMYNTGTKIITVRRMNNGNNRESGQNATIKVEYDTDAVDTKVEGKGDTKCDNANASTKYTVRHITDASGETQYYCDNCQKLFPSTKLFMKHTCLSDIGKTKSKVCDVCGDMFKRHCDLVVHTRKHTGEAPFKCSECGKCFRSQQYLRYHHLTHSNKGTFSCDQCDKTYARKEDLKVHQRKHSGSTPFACDQCPKAFRSKGMLRAHLETHSEVRFECDQCELSYTSRANLARHKIVHSVAVPYVCHHCGQGFNDPSSFKLHNMGHSGDKPHKCETCGRGFLKSTSLRLHQRTHAKETLRPHQCGLCEESFTTEEQLKYHQTLKHGVLVNQGTN